MKRSDCVLVYGSTTKGGVVKRSDCVLVYGSTTKGGVVKRSDCILVYGSTTKGGVVKRSDCVQHIHDISYTNSYDVDTGALQALQLGEILVDTQLRGLSHHHEWEEFQWRRWNYSVIPGLPRPCMSL